MKSAVVMNRVRKCSLECNSLKLIRRGAQPVRSQTLLKQKLNQVESCFSADLCINTMLLFHVFLLHLRFNQALPLTIDKCSLVKSSLNKALDSCQPFSDNREVCRCEEDFDVCKFSFSEVRGWVLGRGGDGEGGGGGGARTREDGLRGIEGKEEGCMFCCQRTLKKKRDDDDDDDDNDDDDDDDDNDDDDDEDKKDDESDNDDDNDKNNKNNKNNSVPNWVNKDIKKKSKAGASSPKHGTALVASVILIILATVVIVSVVAKRRTSIAS